MKKNLFILAAAALALASCSSDETVESAALSKSNEISFRPLVNSSTRAADITLSNLASFVVNAKIAGGETSYFDNVTFNKVGETATYTSTTKYYWPATGNLDFYAYSPAGNSQVTYTNYKTFEVQPSTTVASQVDLVYAATKSKNKASDASGVVLNFRHTGSKIVCKVKNTSTALKFSVEGWKVGFLDNKGKFTFADPHTDGNNTGSGTTLTAGQWTENTTQDVNNAYSSTFDAVDIAAGASETALTGEMILVPQIINKATAYAYTGATAAGDKLNGTFIAVKLKILNATNSAVIASDGDNHMWAIWPIGGTTNDFAWAPGKKYTYTIDLAGGGFYETNQAETTVDEDLDPILGGAEIKFVTVTVDNWTDGGTTNVAN